MATVHCWKNKATITTIILFLSATIALGQQQDNEHLVSNRWSVSIGNISVVDNYLSNQEYSGMLYGFQAQHGAYYKNTEKRVSWHFYDNWRYGKLINASYSATIDYASLNIGFGSHYNWNIAKGLMVKAGSKIDILGAIKYQNRNVNNPASGDIHLQLFASGAVQYFLKWNKFALLFHYSINTPVLGCMFVPEMGQSYYEIYLKLPKGINDITHFTSFHNMQGVDGNFSIQYIFRGFTLYTAFRHDNRWWHANNLSFYNKELSCQIGVIVDLIYRCGLKSQPNNAVTF